MIQEIISTLKVISLNKDNKPLYILGGYIVGATLVRDDYEDLIEQYPVLDTIAELGAELEIYEDKEYSEPLFEEFKRKLDDLEQSIQNQ